VQGIYEVRFFIREKLYVVTVDDDVLFRGDVPYFSGPSGDGRSVWGIVIEKVFIKVVGNYLKTDVGGFMENGIRLMTGVPVFGY